MNSHLFRTTEFLKAYYLCDISTKNAVKNFLSSVEISVKLNTGSIYWNFNEFNYNCVNLIKILCPSFTSMQKDLLSTLYVWNVGDLYVPNEIINKFISINDSYITKEITRTDDWDNSNASRFQTGC